MVWCSYLFQNFPQFIVIHTVEGFGVVNKAETDVFLKLSCFFNDPADIGNLISGHEPDNHNGVITHLEPDILECEVKWALESITTNKASGGDGLSYTYYYI